MRLPHTFRLRSSRRLAALLLAMHATALAVACLAPTPMWFRFALAAAILASAGSSALRLTGSRRICALTLRADGLLEFERASGARGEATVLGQSTALDFLTVLLLRSEGRREALTLLPGAIAAEDFRELRAWLRWRAAPSRFGGRSPGGD